MTQRVNPSIDGDEGFSFFSVLSKKEVANPTLQGHSVIDVACNYERGVLISLSAFRVHDGNAEADQLRSSELTWQTWQIQAGKISRTRLAALCTIIGSLHIGNRKARRSLGEIAVLATA